VISATTAFIRANSRSSRSCWTSDFFGFSSKTCAAEPNSFFFHW